MVFTGRGDDTVIGQDGFDYLNGGKGDDMLLGGGGNDFLMGGRGDDNLDGGTGRDYLVGGAGDDVMTGGTGADVFIFAKGDDTISDFTVGEDTLVLSASLWRGGENPLSAFANNVTIEDGNAVIDFGAGNTLTLTGVTDTSDLDVYGMFC